MIKQIAQQFAEALDANNFDAATSLLSQDCIYNINEKEIGGVDEIIDSYRKADAWCKRTLDAYTYESSVDDCGTITFYDHITHGGKSHVHCCKQRISLGNDDHIVKIEHIELPNEQASIEKFFEQVGISRNT